MGGNGNGPKEHAKGDPSPLERIAIALEQLADRLAPDPENIVGTEYVSAKMGCSQTHVARLARDGDIPASCVVPGCGDGKPWKFSGPGSTDGWRCGSRRQAVGLDLPI